MNRWAVIFLSLVSATAIAGHQDDRVINACVSRRRCCSVEKSSDGTGGRFKDALSTVGGAAGSAARALASGCFAEAAGLSGGMCAEVFGVVTMEGVTGASTVGVTGAGKIVLPP